MHEDDNNNNDNMIWLGEFNRHHPLWDKMRNEHLFTSADLNATERLIECTMGHDMEMVLPPGMATLEAFSTGNHTRPHNVFCSYRLSLSVTKCKAIPHFQPIKTNYYLICTHLECTLLQPAAAHYNYRHTDWEQFDKLLHNTLADHLPLTTDTSQL